MQNRYVADIGDYVKLAILRGLTCERRLGVVWWLYSDERHNKDGGHKEYLEREDKWRHFDPHLFDSLLKIAKNKNRNVSAIENAGILPNATFADDFVPCEMRPFSLRPGHRKAWLAKTMEKVKDCDLIFLDPDNGIASDSVKLTQRRAGKSVLIKELVELQKKHRAIVVYHHQSRFRGGHHSEISDLAMRLTNSGLSVSGALRAKSWSPRVFFILNGDKELQDRAKSLAELWAGHISWHSDFKLSRRDGVV